MDNTSRPKYLKSDADDAASTHFLFLNHHHPALQRRAFAAFATFLARPPPSALRPPPPCSLLPTPRSPLPTPRSPLPTPRSPLPTPRPPPFRPLFPSDHVLPSLPSLFLFFLHLIRLLFSCHPFHVPVAPVSISSRNRRHHEDNLDTLGSLVLCYSYSLLLARAHKQLHGFFPRAPGVSFSLPFSGTISDFHAILCILLPPHSLNNNQHAVSDIDQTGECDIMEPVQSR
ncbi:hypothetical protein C8J57DRAFT_1627479 [Mycena rebaudengoi]|nr:hypothetical protein C8J57DRAFT_1627479 [Mycena rebaudengoi]